MFITMVLLYNFKKKILVNYVISATFKFDKLMFT